MFYLAEFIFSSRKQYWSALKNNHANLNNSGSDMLRKAYYNLTKNKIYLEKNFKKRQLSGKAYSIKEVRKGFKIAKLKHEKIMKKEWLELKRDGAPIGSFKRFLMANSEPDFDEIREMFNSPK